MASSPEQEIPQEIIQKAWEAGANRKYEFGDVSSLTFDAMTRALAAVLPDLQRPLLEEIERERETRKALAQIADERKTERDARPDLTAEEMRRILPKLGDDLLTARAKLERSLDAHKP